MFYFIRGNFKLNWNQFLIIIALNSVHLIIILKCFLEHNWMYNNFTSIIVENFVIKIKQWLTIKAQTFIKELWVGIFSPKFWSQNDIENSNRIDIHNNGNFFFLIISSNRTYDEPSELEIECRLPAWHCGTTSIDRWINDRCIEPAEARLRCGTVVWSNDKSEQEQYIICNYRTLIIVYLK